MFELVLVGAAALRSAFLADPQASDDALVAAGLAAIDALDIAQQRKDNARKPGTRRLLGAVIWCLRNGKTSIVQGWAGTGQAGAEHFDPKSAAALDKVLAGEPAPVPKAVQ